eukprot:14450-Heterococcus_DN1.PRE.1
MQFRHMYTPLHPWHQSVPSKGAFIALLQYHYYHHWLIYMYSNSRSLIRCCCTTQLSSAVDQTNYKQFLCDYSEITEPVLGKFRAKFDDAAERKAQQTFFPVFSTAAMGACMQKSSAAESSAAESRNPLLEPNLLQNVLSYVGPGHCLFVAPVSRWWKHWYTELYIRRVTEHDQPNRERIFTCRCISKRTQYSSVFASPSRAQLALESGLDSTSKGCQ